MTAKEKDLLKTLIASNGAPYVLEMIAGYFREIAEKCATGGHVWTNAADNVERAANSFCQIDVDMPS